MEFLITLIWININTTLVNGSLKYKKHVIFLLRKENSSLYKSFLVFYTYDFLLFAVIRYSIVLQLLYFLSSNLQGRPTRLVKMDKSCLFWRATIMSFQIVNIEGCVWETWQKLKSRISFFGSTASISNETRNSQGNFQGVFHICYNLNKPIFNATFRSLDSIIICICLPFNKERALMLASSCCKIYDFY